MYSIKKKQPQLRNRTADVVIAARAWDAPLVGLRCRANGTANPMEGLPAASCTPTMGSGKLKALGRAQHVPGLTQPWLHGGGFGAEPELIPWRRQEPLQGFKHSTQSNHWPSGHFPEQNPRFPSPGGGRALCQPPSSSKPPLDWAWLAQKSQDPAWPRQLLLGRTQPLDMKVPPQSQPEGSPPSCDPTPCTTQLHWPCSCSACWSFLLI